MHIRDTQVRRWLQERMEPTRNQPAARPPAEAADPAQAQRRRAVRDVPAHALRRPEAVLARRRRDADPAARRDRRAVGAGTASARSSWAWRTAAGSTCWPTSWTSPTSLIFAEFEENYVPDSVGGDGDVKYHLGFSADRVTADGQHDPPLADAQPEPPGGGRPRRRGPDAGQAAAVRRPRPQARHAGADPRRRRLRRPGARGRDAQPLAAAPATAPAARSTSSSTTRSASPPRRPTPARRRTAPTWPR